MAPHSNMLSTAVANRLSLSMVQLAIIVRGNSSAMRLASAFALLSTAGVITAAEHVDDLEALLRLLDAAPAHLVGHSYGAFVCLLLAIRKPQIVWQQCVVRYMCI
jgi:pimeloyl-ACP methyl ester carboxylesterase